MAKDIPHGTLSGYGTHKCRCDDCRAANTEYTRRRREADPETYATYRRRTYEANREKSAEYSRRRREADPGYRRRQYEATREKTAENTRRWRAENPEKVKENRRRYMAENADKIREDRRRWEAENPDKVISNRSLKNQRRRARMRDAFIEDVPPLEIFERDNWQCQIPGCRFPGVPARLDAGRYGPLLASLDHIIPLSKGGKHERSNLACSHLQCNQVKQDRVEGIA
jgi:hypothetical protein